MSPTVENKRFGSFGVLCMEQLHNLVVMGVSFFSIILIEDGCKPPWKMKYSYKDFHSSCEKKIQHVIGLMGK